MTWPPLPSVVMNSTDSPPILQMDEGGVEWNRLLKRHLQNQLVNFETSYVC